MLDIKFVRDNPDAVKGKTSRKFQDARLPLVDEVIEGHQVPRVPERKSSP